MQRLVNIKGVYTAFVYHRILYNLKAIYLLIINKNKISSKNNRLSSNIVAIRVLFSNTESDKEKAMHAKTCYAKPPV